MKKEIIEEVNRCLNCANPKCKEACPIHLDIPSFIKTIKEGNLEEAFVQNSNTNPFGAICGLICPHEKQCEGACIRGIKGTPVRIGKIENDLCDAFIMQRPKLVKRNSIDTLDELNNDNIQKNKVAIIGGGPSGLSCAYFLSKGKIHSTIFEKENRLGGILNYGIPDFRLDKNLVEKSLNFIINDYIDVQINTTFVGQKTQLSEKIKVVDQKKEYREICINDLKQEGYEYIYLCFGNENSKMLNVQGIDLKQVIGANEFLRNYNDKLEDTLQKYSNKRICVVGGGNVAIDSARVGIKLGADVMIVYRRLRENMPANKSEIEEADKEGVKYIYQKNITKIISNNDGSLMLLLDDNSEIETDYLIIAIGSKINEKYLEDVFELENGLIKINSCYETNQKNIFAGGDLVQNKSTVVNAIKDGKEVAFEIIKRINT